jgi:hypothetical protein
MCPQRVAWRDQHTLTASHFHQLEAWVEGLVNPLSALHGWGLLRTREDEAVNTLPVLGPPSAWTQTSDGREAVCELKPVRMLTPSGRLLDVPKRLSLTVKFTHKQLKETGGSALPVYLVAGTPAEEPSPMRPYEPPVALATRPAADAVQIAEFKLQGKDKLVPTDPFIPECVDLGSCDGLAHAARAVRDAAETCRRAAARQFAAVGTLGTVTGETVLRLEALRAAGGACRVVTLMLADPRQPARRFIRVATALAEQTQTVLSELGFELEGFARGTRALCESAKQPNLAPFFDQFRASFKDLQGWVEGVRFDGPRAKPDSVIRHGAGGLRPVPPTRWQRVEVPLLAPLKSSVSSGERVQVQLKTTRPAPDGETVRVHPVAVPGDKGEDGQVVAQQCKLVVRDTTASFRYTPGDADLAESRIVFYVGPAVAAVLRVEKGGVIPAEAVRICRK